jgi:hypothetical protein
VDCQCPTDVTRPVTVWVDRGTIEYLLYEDDGRPVPFSYANSFPSAEQLFDAIQDGIDRRADLIDVEYDPTYGYPTSVYIDYDRRVADEELSLTTRGLRQWERLDQRDRGLGLGTRPGCFTREEARAA